MTFVIAIIATILAFMQNTVMFSLGMKEMAIFAFPLSFVGILLAEVVLIWAAYFFIRRFLRRCRALVLAGWAIVVLGAAEPLLPAKHLSDLEKEATVALGEIPVPSLRAICRRLGITVPFMNKHFPGVARMIVEQHRRHVSAEAANRHELLLRGIPDIAAELHSRGLYPSVERILERLPEKSRRDWKTITFAVREAHKALGIPR